MQWGGLTDPFDPFEREFGVSLELLAETLTARGEAASTSGLLSPSPAPLLPADAEGRYAGDENYGPFSRSTEPRQGAGVTGYGYKPEDFYANSSLAFQCIHPDDRESLLESLKECRTTGRPASTECRVVYRDDEPRTFQTEIQVGMVGVNVPIPVPMAFHSFGGWKRSLFGDIHMHGVEGVHFYTKLKTVTSRWPTGIRAGADFHMPTMQ